MFVKTVAILSVISICVDGFAPDHLPKHAVSTQSYHRGDVPLSYKFTAVHIYTTPRPEEQRPHLLSNDQENSKYHTIQYAPLVKNTYSDHRYNVPEIVDTFKNSEEIRKGHLEPREVEHFDTNDQSYRSFVSGHNVEVLQSNRLKGYGGLYRDYHDNLVNQKVNLPKFVVHQNPQKYITNIPETFREIEQRPLSEEHEILYSFLPRPAVRQQNAYAIDHSHKVPHTLAAKIPRLHLNLARVYGIAHLNHQAPSIKSVHRPIPNAPAYTQAIFQPLKAPQKTMLYPVQDPKKNYPVHM